jgi:hypothetical protein
MPGGRVPVKGGRAWGKLSTKVSIKTLAKYGGRKQLDLNCRDFRDAHKQIRNAVNLYRLAHGTHDPRGGQETSGPKTRTRIIAAVKKVKVCAASVVKSGSQKNWLDRLAEALSVKAELLADLHYAMRRENMDPGIFSLRNRINAGTYSSDDFDAVKMLAELDPQKVVPPSGNPDPPLERLVSELAPVWSNVTGTSNYPKNLGDGTKFTPFADWLSELIVAAGLRPPPRTSIPRIIVRKKKLKK